MRLMTRPAGYAVAMLHDIVPAPALQTYLTEIDDTLERFDGSFLIHGGAARVAEGTLTCDLIAIGFRDPQGAQDWYDSPPYQRLAALRRTFAKGTVILCNGEDSDHRALDILSRGTHNPTASTAQGPR